MFKEEWLVYVDAIDPSDYHRPVKVQLFVDGREVSHLKDTPKRNEPAWAWLQVSLVATRGQLASVVLPQPAIPFGANVLVRQELLKGTPAL
ncbi:MAG: hypothetical protein L0Y72_02220 [Gemmataceae bacterium]|nr:hypothetical protein [Gemmataceae bacterium]MCI0737831.1 hypothetical protein [Gemmataceae bacterium]